MKNFFNSLRAFASKLSVIPTVIVFAIFVLQTRHIGYLENQLEKSKTTISARDRELSDLRFAVQNYLIVSGEYEKPAKEVLPLFKKFGLIQEN